MEERIESRASTTSVADVRNKYIGKVIIAFLNFVEQVCSPSSQVASDYNPYLLLPLHLL